MRILLMGAVPSVDLERHTSVSDRLMATGGNVGNQLIGYGALKTIKYTSISCDYSAGPDSVNENFDKIVIPAANFINSNSDFSGWANFLEATRLPIVVMGLGAQASTTNNPKISLKPGTTKFINLLSQRCHTLGVRGEFTAEVLYRMGINNTQVIGCPSYYIGPEEIPVKTKETIRLDNSVVIHCSRDVIGHSSDPVKMHQLVNGLYREASKIDATFIAQTEKEEMLLATDIDSTVRADAVRAILDSLSINEEVEMVTNWLERRMRVFWNVEEWIGTLRAASFVIGTRIHGTIAAMHAGVPAICLAHDSRTKELCDFLSIPMVEIEKIGDFQLQYLRDQYDPSSLNLKRRRLMDLYEYFLIRNGLVPAIRGG